MRFAHGLGFALRLLQSDDTQRLSAVRESADLGDFRSFGLELIGVQAADQEIAEHDDAFGIAQLLRIDEIGLDRGAAQFRQDFLQVGCLAAHVIGQGPDAQTRLHRPVNAVDRIDPQDRRARRPRLGPGGQQPIQVFHRRAGVVAVDDQVVVVQVLRLLWGAVGLQVFGRGKDVVVHGHQVRI